MIGKIIVEDFVKLIGPTYKNKLVAGIINTLNYCVYIPFYKIEELDEKIMSKCEEMGWDAECVIAIHSAKPNITSSLGNLIGSCLIVNNHTIDSFAHVLKRIMALKVFL